MSQLITLEKIFKFVTIQERNIPLKSSAETLTLLFPVRDETEKHSQVEAWNFVEQAKPRHLVLNRMCGENSKFHRFSSFAMDVARALQP